MLSKLCSCCQVSLKSNFLPTEIYLGMLKFVTVTPKKPKADVMAGADTKTDQVHNDKQKLVYKEVRGDLFKCEPEVSLAHCVSVDLRMGKGIAVIFRKTFGGVPQLKDQGKKIGDVAVLKRGQKYIYYLITKECYWHKPTYDSVQASLQAMRQHCLDNNICFLAMPKIGCGLDGLTWERVSPIIKDVFDGMDMELTVYYL